MVSGFHCVFLPQINNENNKMILPFPHIFFSFCIKLPFLKTNLTKRFPWRKYVHVLTCQSLHFKNPRIGFCVWLLLTSSIHLVSICSPHMKSLSLMGDNKKEENNNSDSDNKVRIRTRAATGTSSLSRKHTDRCLICS